MFTSVSFVRQGSVVRPVVGKRAAHKRGVQASVFGLGGATATGGMYDIAVKDIDGKDLKLSKYAGKVVLVVNVASACGFTPQYNDLVQLDKKYSSKGLVIIGAPCNQFGAQEPGSNADIKKFAAARGAKFPMLSKLDVNGPYASPLYKFLKAEKGGVLTSDVKWNFSKFLVDREGNVVERYFSTSTPTDITGDIEKYL